MSPCPHVCRSHGDPRYVWNFPSLQPCPPESSGFEGNAFRSRLHRSKGSKGGDGCVPTSWATGNVLSFVLTESQTGFNSLPGGSISGCQHLLCLLRLLGSASPFLVSGIAPNLHPFTTRLVSLSTV